MKLIMLCGVPCNDREKCLEEQKESFDNVVVVDNSTTETEIQKYISDRKHIIWNEPNLYPEIRKTRLSLFPENYHKTAIYFKPTYEEIEERDVKILSMQFVPPTEFENFDCIMRYM